jgi:glycosyltransferase involved in cell wall biosynthesis
LKTKDTIGILTFVPNVWGGYWMPRHYIMSGLSQYYKILWVSPPLGWRNTGKNRSINLNLYQRGLKKISPNFWAYAPERYLPSCLPFGTCRVFLNYIREKKINSMLKAMGVERVALYLWRPNFAKFLGKFNEEFVCYHVDDEYSFSDVESKIDEREQYLLKNSDFVFIHSKTLFKKKGMINPETYYVPNGVDFTHYRRIVEDKNLERNEMDSIPKPRIGYVGWIKQQIDLEIILKISRIRKDWSIVLVGPINTGHENVGQYVKLLRKEKNVFFIGGKKPKDLPKYINKIDVCLLCYKKTFYTNYIYPMKLHEYLACGKPVVATSLENLKEFENVLSFADGIEEWIKEIDHSLKEIDSKSHYEKRVAVARKNSWDTRIETIHSVIQQKML